MEITITTMKEVRQVLSPRDLRKREDAVDTDTNTRKQRETSMWTQLSFTLSEI